jgi:cytochrome c oxidase subunit 2
VLAGRTSWLTLSALLAACHGPQSALEPAGRGATRIAELFWWMTIGGSAIFVAFMALSIYALRSGREYTPRAGRLLVIGGGVVFPTVVLAALLSWGLAMLPPMLAPARAGSLRIAVTGEQYWWRVRYLPPGGAPVDLANEVRLPVGEPVELVLESRDVIHSFWIPSLGGKMDMIPGRTTRLVLEPTRTGELRGACAEFCGTSHALMAFAAVVEEGDAFAAWLAEQARPARAPEGELAARGAALFDATGCGACHTVRGTSADGVLGPDLTHVGSRRTIGAGLLAPTREGFVAWLAHTATLKPRVHMPAFGMLAAADVDALAAYLEGLR